MQKTPYVFPIIGGRKVEHLVANLEALNIALGDEHIKYLESILPFDFGFPYSAFVSSPSLALSFHISVYSDFGFRTLTRLSRFQIHCFF